MKAVRKLAPGPGHVALSEVPEPRPGPGQIKVRVRAAGVCGTDIHILHGGYRYAPPVTLGHEFCGEVVEVGSDVRRVRVGDRVVINPSVAGTCGICRHCRVGRYMLCSRRASLGSLGDGAFAEHCVTSEISALPLGESVPDEAGALAEPLACCVQATSEVTSVAPGDTVLISGPGPIGLLCLALVKLGGAVTVVCGTSGDGERLALAREMGADATVEVTHEDLESGVLDLTRGHGVDIAFECAGVGPSVDQCLRAVAKGGRVVQVGVIERPVEIEFGLVLFKQLRVFGVFGQTWTAWETALGLLGRGAIDLAPFVTARYPLDQWRNAFEDMEERRGLRSVLCP